MEAYSNQSKSYQRASPIIPLSGQSLRLPTDRVNPDFRNRDSLGRINRCISKAAISNVQAHGEHFRQQVTACSHEDIDYIEKHQGMTKEQVNAAIKPLLEEQARRRSKTLLRVLLLCSQIFKKQTQALRTSPPALLLGQTQEESEGEEGAQILATIPIKQGEVLFRRRKSQRTLSTTLNQLRYCSQVSRNKSKFSGLLTDSALGTGL